MSGTPTILEHVKANLSARADVAVVNPGAELELGGGVGGGGGGRLEFLVFRMGL